MASAWFYRQRSMQPLYVDIYNGTTETMPEVAITHGKASLQEHILGLQTKPGESRINSLTHQSELGFNVDAMLNSGPKFSIYAAKDEAVYIHFTIASRGIITP